MKRAGIFIAILGLCVLLTACGEQKAYDDACALFESGRYAEAIEMFMALGDYSDSADRIRIAQTRLEQTNASRNADDSIQENALIYNEAMSCIENGRTREAYLAFQSLGSYRDSEARQAQFTVIANALVSDQTHYISASGEDTLRGSSVYTYGADKLAVSRSGFCRLERYGLFEDFDLVYSYDSAGRIVRTDGVSRNGNMSFTAEYSYNETGRVERESYSDSLGRNRSFSYEYTYHDATGDSEPYTEVIVNELFSGHPFPIETLQESYCEFGVSTVRCADYTLVNRYGPDGRCVKTIQTYSDGSRYETEYSYEYVYVYTPAC